MSSCREEPTSAEDHGRPPQRTSGRAGATDTAAPAPPPVPTLPHPSPRAVSPAKLLAIQRTGGNRAANALLSRPAPPRPVAQRLATFTTLKNEHAVKVLENARKGDPPFKPQKGNFGPVSWFAGK